MSRELIERLEADQRAIVDDLARIQYTLDLLRRLHKLRQSKDCSCYETVLDSWRNFVVARLAEAGYQVEEDFIENFESLETIDRIYWEPE